MDDGLQVKPKEDRGISKKEQVGNKWPVWEQQGISEARHIPPRTPVSCHQTASDV